jgi:hypothetical protein
MICPDCEERWTPFPPEDWGIHHVFGPVPKSYGSGVRRKEILDSNEKKRCPECEKKKGSTAIPLPA